MALKYYAYFNSTAWAGVTSTRYKIEIYDTTFSGTATEVTTGANPFSEKELNNEETTYGIKGCRFDIDIVSDVVTVEDFYTQEGMSHRVKLYEAPLVGDMTLIRDGYLLSEDVQEVYQDGIKVIQLSGTDGLELLKTIPFEFSADKPYTGVMTALLLLDRCVTPIGLELNVNTSFNYYQDGQSKIASFEPLAFFNVHAPLFKGKTCYEALSMLCETLRCVIFQEDGEWWFVHTLNPDNTTQYYRKWDSDFNSLSNGTLPSAITVEFEGEYAPCNDPKKLKKRSYKSVNTDVDIQDYINKLRNPDFTSGITEWVDGGVDSYASGGDGTNLNPYYLQINGYQNKTALDFLNIKYVSQNVATLYDVTTDDSISGKLDTSIKVSGKVLGNGVKFGNVGLFLRIETDSPLAPNLILCLSDSGEWIHLGLTQTAGLSGVLDVISGIRFNILKNIISIPLTDSDGVQIDDWKGFEIESKNISEIVLNMNKSIGFIDNIIGGALEQFYQIDVEDFTKVELYMVIYEGYDNTVGSSDPRNIKYGNLNLEIKDKSRLVGLKKDRYFSEQSNPAPNKLEVNAYFSDFQDNTQLISMLQSDEVTPTILWEDSSGNNVGELMMGLNRELLSLYYKPTSLYDGDILGKVKKYHKINLVEFANELINLNWNFDFGEGIASGVRYIMTFANYGTFTNTKYGIYSDDKQIKYDGSYPTGVYEFDQVPALKPDLIARNLLEIKASSLFSDGYATFSKINPKSGIQWFDAANNKTDYFLTTEDGFVMKSETNPYEVTLDFTELTANTKLIIPPLSADAYLLTSENGWVLEGNNISTAKKLGSTTAQDWTIINNDTTVATVKEGFLDLGDNKLGLGKVNFIPTTAQDVTDAGDLAWDADRKTLSLRFNGDHGHVMQDQFYYVKNQTGSTITKGSFVGFAGSLGASGILLISKFIANNTTDSQNFMGVAHEDIPNGGDGRVIHFGEVRGIDLTGISDGTKLYASTTTAGAWQTTVPVAPNNIILVAAVKNGGSNGSIHVRPTIGSKLANDESVLFGTLANNNLLAYESATSLWKNKTYSELGLFPTPSGLTTNYVTKWNGTALANSQIFDSGTLIGLGTAIPATLLDVRGQISANIGSASSPTFSFVGDLNTGMYSSAADTINFATGGVNRANISSVGNLSIGTAASTSISFANRKIVTGSTFAYANYSDGVIQSDVTGAAWYYRSVANTQATTFTLPDLRHFNASQGTFGAGSAVTVQTGFYADNTLTGGVTNYGFRGAISAASNRWNLFMDGTAQNYFRGNVGIGSGSTVPATELEVRGVISASLGSASLPSHTFVGDLNNGWWSPAADTQAWSLSGAEVMRLNATGLGIGVTPSYKLDVSGTGHFTGAVTFDTVPSSLQDATSANHLVRYSQWISGTTVKYLPTAVKTVSLTNITLSGTQTVNGVALIATDRILVTGQTAGAENGVWVVAAGSWTRATDSDTDTELRGFIINVSGGTYAGYKYINTNQSTITVGTTAITYSEFSNVSEIDPIFTSWRDTTRTANTFWAAPNGSNGAGTWRTIVAADIPTLNQNTTGSAATLTTARSIGMTGDVDWSVSFNGSGNVTAAGTLASVNSDIGTFNNVTVNAKGLVTAASNVSYLTGNQTITISGDASGIGSTSIALTLATVATAGTYRSVTINAKGLVTSGTNPTTLAGYGITDAQPLDSDLTAIAGLTGTNGLLRKTDTNTWILDTNSYFQTPTGLTTNYVTKWNGSALANSTIFDNGSNVGIGVVPLSTSTLQLGRNLTGGTVVFGSIQNGVVQSDATSQAYGYYNVLNTQATTFNVGSYYHYATLQGTIGAGSTVGTQGGFLASSTLIGGTNNFGFRGAIPSGTGRWNLYMDGTAQNYVAGNLGIGSGTTTPSEALHLTGNIRYSGTLKPSNTAGTNGQFLKTTGTADSWATLTTSDISNLSSYTGLDVRYFTETESDARFVALSGSYGNPSWITSLAWSKLTGVPSTFEPSAHTLDSHSNVTITSNSSGEILKWDGSEWINNTLSEAGIQATLGGTGIVKSSGGVISYIADNTSNWNTAYGWGNHASAGYLTTSLAATTYQPLDGDLTAIAGLSGTSGFLKKTAVNTWTLDTSTYLTGNQTITISGDATGSGATSIALTLANSGVTSGTYRSVTVNSKGLVTAGTNPTTVSGYGITDFYSQVVSGFVTGANSSVLNTDTLEVALEKLQGQINARISGNQTITLSGIVTGSGTTAITTSIANGAITNAMLANTAVANLSGTNTGDNSPNSLYSGLVSNATHTGDATGATSLTVVGIRGVSLPTLGVTAGFLRYTGTGTNTWVFDTSTYLTANQSISITGDATGTGTTSIALTLANVATAGTYRSVTINSKGLVTSGTNPTTISGYGITDFYSQVVSGFVTGANSTVLNTDTLEVALEKLQGQINARISGNQTITLSGVITGSGTTAITTSIADATLSIAKTSGLQTALDSKQATLSGTGLVLSTAGTITYVTNNSANWNTAFGWGNHASAGYLLSSTASTTYQPLDADLTAIAALSGTSGFLKKTAANTWSLDTNTYITGNQTITLSGIVTGSGTTAITTAIADSALSIAKTSGLQTALDGKFATPSGLTTNYVSKWNGTGFSNSQIFDNGTNVGIGTTILTGISFRNSKTITGGSSGFSYSNLSDGIIQSDVTGAAWYYRSIASTQATSFTLPEIRHFNASQGTIGAGSTVTVQTGFYVDNTLIGATTNYGFRSAIPSGSNRWNAFMDGTAQNYFRGNVGIGVGRTVPAYELDVAGTIRATTLMITSGATVGSFLKANNVNGTSVWSTILTSDVYNLETILEGKQEVLNAGTGFIYSSGGISYINGTEGQILTKDSAGNPNFMDLNINPHIVSYESIAVGDYRNYLSEQSNFKFRDKRYLSIERITDSDTSIELGLYRKSNNAFIKANGGTLDIDARNGLYLSAFASTGRALSIVTIDASGRLSVSAFGSGGSGGGSVGTVDQVLAAGNTAYNKTLTFENSSAYYFNFKDNSGNQVGAISGDASVVPYLSIVSRAGYDLELSAGENLRLLGDTINLGYSNTNKNINIQGSNFNFNQDSQNDGTGQNPNKWGSGFNQSAPVVGDRIALYYDGTRWVPSHLHTRVISGYTCLTID